MSDMPCTLRGVWNKITVQSIQTFCCCCFLNDRLIFKIGDVIDKSCNRQSMIAVKGVCIHWYPSFGMIPAMSSLVSSANVITTTACTTSDAKFNYNDVIMSATTSQITSLAIVYLTVYSRRGSKKTSKLRFTGLCAGNSPVNGEFPTQKAGVAENVSIWWRHVAS